LILTYAAVASALAPSSAPADDEDFRSSYLKANAFAFCLSVLDVL